MVIAAAPGQQRPGYMGRVLPGFDAQVVDERDEPVPDGTPGEFVLRHRELYAFANGYFALPDKTLEAWRNLWFHTSRERAGKPIASFDALIAAVCRSQGAALATRNVADCEGTGIDIMDPRGANSDSI
jgi:hypothetical protein